MVEVAAVRVQKLASEVAVEGCVVACSPGEDCGKAGVGIAVGSFGILHNSGKTEAGPGTVGNDVGSFAPGCCSPCYNHHHYNSGVAD